MTPPSRKPKLKRLLAHINRNTVLFLGGVLGVAHETLLVHAERPTLLILFAAMMGLPAFLSPGTTDDVGFDKHKDQEEIKEKEIEESTNDDNNNNDQNRRAKSNHET